MTHPDLVSQTIFCEMARTEANNQVTLIGIFPDSLNLEGPLPPVGEDQKVRSKLPNFCAYSRTRIPLDRTIKGPVVLKFSSPDGREIFGHVFEEVFLEENWIESKAQGNEYLVLISQIMAQPFVVVDQGRFVMTVSYGGETYFSGAIRFKFTHKLAEKVAI